MTYVVTEPCVGNCHAECAQVCPVFCIDTPTQDGPTPNSQSFIDPARCVDCGHCVPVCPVNAIYPMRDVPVEWTSFIEKNAAHFAPKATPTLLDDAPAPSHADEPVAEFSRSYGPTISISSPTDIDHEKAMPIWEGQKTPLFVSDIIEETADVRTFRFQSNPLCRFIYKAGQFCTLVLNIDGKKVLRSYTISSTPSRPYTLEITVKRVPGGLVSNWLIDNLKIGDPIEIAGPKGKFCLHPGKIPQKLLFVSAGSGVTPMMAMSRWICDVCADVDIKFFNSARAPHDIIFRKELEHLTSTYKAFSPILTTTSREASDGWLGFRGRVSRDMLEFCSPDIHERHIFMCGPNPFMDAVKEILKEMNFDMANLHLESFGGVRTSKKNKPIPKQSVQLPTLDANALQKEEAEVDNQSIEIVFSKSQKTVKTDGSLSLLDLAEENDIDLDYSCRSGCCGECIVRLVDGEVEQECDDALDDDQKAKGYVLSCVSKPKGKCTVEA